MVNNENEFSNSLNPSNNLNEQNPPNLVLTTASKDFLLETAKWAKFISLVGLIIIGIYLVLLLFMSTMFSSVFNQMFSKQVGMEAYSGILSGTYFFVIIVILLIYITPIWMLYKFSTKIKHAILQNNSEELQVSLNFLRRHYKFIGILVVIMLSFYALLIVGGFIISIISSINS
ncbi:hypothetical protein ACFRAE_04865 [Sphingobacterium sp. HJSM2_6]|uniref:hypothetical protein n=1 Tax=Sphingobacterium sp. HJSM2_6 TaxID=3366264 RepID=UPI003BE45A3C